MTGVIDPLGSGPDDAVVVEDGTRAWTRRELRDETEALAALLSTNEVRVLATVLDNSPAWVVADLAAAQAGVVHVPLPGFFTLQQIEHALAAAGTDALLVPRNMAGSFAGHSARQGLALAGAQVDLLRLSHREIPLPAGTAKITFTSGSTGTPKGVCLGSGAMAEVAEGVAQATDPLGITRHLCALPFAVLLENIAGLFAPLSRGATCVVLPLRELGLVGSSSFDPAAFQRASTRHRPHSVILLPQMLRAWVDHLLRSRQRAVDSLKLVAVGGAAVGSRLILRARSLGIPAFEGYGLSEGGSVQALGLPGIDRPGTVGKPLPHARIRVGGDGELEIAGSLFLGYLGARPLPANTWLPTGDLGHIDRDGFVQVHGRRKNLLITAFGRNVSPEWVEAVLQGGAEIAQAVVFGDGQPSLSAVLWPASNDVSDTALDRAVAAANARLRPYRALDAR